MNDHGTNAMRNNVRTILMTAALIASTGMNAQLLVNSSLTPQQLVEDVLVGSCVSVSNITYNGSATPPPGDGRGAFTTGTTNLGIGAGVILASGNVGAAAGLASSFASSTLGSGSDPDLAQLAGGPTINDRSVLEFDFVPEGDSINFRFVFGSEEYPEFVCSGFNDAFGFFLSGPGIAGPFSGGAINLALVPNTTIPITINTINSGTPGGAYPASTCAASDPNWQANSVYYVDNTGGTTIAYDGFTVVLTARAAVQCGQTYHIKLAIGDAGDSAYDSGVFLEAGSFTSTPFIPDIAANPAIIGNTILQSCYDLDMNIIRVSCDPSLEETVYFSFGGTAVMGTDITGNFPDSLVFAPGDTLFNIPFQAPITGNGPGTWIITLTAVDCNGDLSSADFTYFLDPPDIPTISGYDVNIQCGDTVTLNATFGGGFPPLSVTWGALGSGPSITVSPTAFTLYTATVTDTCGQTASATFGVGLIELPPINANILGPGLVIEGCETTSINIIRPQGVPGDLTIDLITSGSAQNGVDYVLPPTVVIPASQLNLIVPFVPLEDNIPQGIHEAIIVVSFTDDCGRTVQAQVSVLIDDAPPIFLELEPFFVVECADDSLLLEAFAQGGYGGQLNLTWSSGATGAIAWADMQQSSTYTVTATDGCGRSVEVSTFVQVECDVVIPNVFSPNGDGMNDYWVIDGITSKQNTVRIYNRWGQTVYSTSNYRNNWAGTDLPDGTYFYEVLVLNRGEQEVHTGHLTLLRNRW